MKKLALIFIASMGGCGAPAEPDIAAPGNPVALKCTGKLRMMTIRADGFFEDPSIVDVHKMVIVDEVRKTLQTDDLKPDGSERPSYYTPCWEEGTKCAMTVSPTTIEYLATNDKKDNEKRVQFIINRNTGQVRELGRYGVGYDLLHNGSYDCRPVSVPLSYRLEIGPPAF